MCSLLIYLTYLIKHNIHILYSNHKYNLALFSILNTTVLFNKHPNFISIASNIVLYNQPVKQLIQVKIVPQVNQLIIIIIGKSIYSKYGKRFCASKTIYNQLSTTSPYIELIQNTTLPPIYGILYNSSQTVINSSSLVIYYGYNGNGIDTFNGQTCSQIVNRMGLDIQLLQIAQLQQYITSLQYLFYTLCPILLFTIISILIQTFTKYDCKSLMQISLFNACIISLSIIIIGIVFDIKSRLYQETIKWLGLNCVLQGTNIQSINEMISNLSIDYENGLSTGFTIGIGVVGGVQIFMIICLIIVWVIQIKLHRIKKQDFSSNYQLQTM